MTPTLDGDASDTDTNRASDPSEAEPSGRSRDSARRVRWTAVRHALTIAGLVYLVVAFIGLVPYGTDRDPRAGISVDSYAYWSADLDDPYDNSVIGERGSYLYSPAFLQVLTPLRALPWPVFAALWSCLGIAALFALRVPWLLAFPPVVDDIARGNVQVLMAAAVILAFKYPGFWAFAILTKVTPGVGLLWYVVRRDWPMLGIAAGTTALIVVVSFAASPSLWLDWFAMLERSMGVTPPIRVIPIPLSVRLGIGAVIVVAAAVMQRRWIVPIGMTMALPGLWPSSFALLAASVVLWRDERRAAAQEESVAELRET